MFEIDSLQSGRVLRLVCPDATFADAIDRWQRDAGFRSGLLDALRVAPFTAYRWEMPPLRDDNLARGFELVIVDSPGLDRAADRDAFAAHFDEGEDVVAFDNLGGDARLVVPCPRGPDTTYAHIASFVRSAPQAQQHALLERVGVEMAARVSPDPVWLSTAGGGVAWLHVRLDARPKYYSYRDYARPDA